MTGRLLLDDLIDARRREFAGRHEELSLFESVLAAGGGAVYVHGPGGIGKTSLLHQYEWLGSRQGRRVVRFDAAGTGRSAGAVLDGLARATGVNPGGAPVTAEDALAALTGSPGLLLIIDGAEHLATLDRWLREEVLARLPGDAIVVLAGRHAPALGWRADPGWRSMLRVVPLRELDPADSAEVLRRQGVPASARDVALAFARGHPLALVMAAEIGPALAARAGPPAGAPDALRDLLAVLLDSVPSRHHRAALEASAQVRVTTKPLLAALLDESDVHDVFEWLRELSIMEYADHGVRPHELVRDLLSAELRWRDPERHAAIHGRAGEHYHRRLHAGDAVLFDLAYLHRESPLLGPYLSCVTPGPLGPTELAVTPMREDEWPRLRGALVRHEGQESARLADGWASPTSVSVVRTANGAPVGFFVLLALEALDPAARDADPATAAAWRHLRLAGPLAPGQTGLHVRWWLAEEEYQDVSPAQTLMTLHLVRLYLTVPGLAVTFLPVADPAFWAEACAYADMTRVPEADFEVDGRRYGVFAHDWRVTPPHAWLRLLAAREVAAEAVPPPAPTVAALDERDFVAAVRDALRELGRPDRLADSPLARTAVVAGRPDDEPAVPEGPERGRAVERIIREAAGVLEQSARDRSAYRVLHHTYLQPAGTQQRAAELLDLPMSTYRRRLAEGLDRLATLLWRRELAARMDGTDRN